MRLHVIREHHYYFAAVPDIHKANAIEWAVQKLYNGSISDAGGDYPIWSRTGRELFFRSPDNRIMVASYKIQGDSIVPDQPRVWSQKRLADFANSGIASYDLAPDGKRVAALMPVETPEAQQAENHVIS
jgi:hypothetical protein